MEFVAFIIYGLFGLFFFYLIIKSAVAKGIDSSIEMKLLKNEIKDLKKQIIIIKEEQGKNHFINSKI